MDTQLSFRRLEVFRLVVDERSVTRAAEILMVAQPAVSAQLRALESWVGAALFVRRGNRLVLTEAGERTNEWAKNVLAGAAQVRRDVGDLASGDAGRVLVSSSMAVGTYLLAPILAKLGKQRPNVDITVSISRPEESIRGVESGEFDFAVLNWDERHLSDSTESEVLQTVKLSVYATEHLVAIGTTLTVDEALALPMVGAPSEVVYQRNLVAQLRAEGYDEPSFVIRLGHSEAMVRAAIEHDWAIIAPSYAVGSDSALRPIDVPDFSLKERIVLVHRKDKHFSPLQLATLDAVRHGLEGAAATSSQRLNEDYQE
ncbi:LysR family transcriptional regulator [Rhodococcus sp. 05-340-1]|uniref:LysR family transcriptional regulator n=1 Tax=Nocardiaceae TaxID=85025 RepID=UPI00050D02F7|nr:MULTISPECIES: LysR family transcriptional regulator [Rhodococcus]OZC87671.1 LysR family transcriptional regulator [Rhodococcus sp. 06-412-2C]OZC96322.1 LysR family transcriptional regulator [Rhodococcus sp. 06-412-2B]OZD65305.1 LysR family transcriptional regulator [Rhodococcus sp. 05-340-2]OZD74649.1 LysR family transcriptional regulator [Rhodococcus sp. 05-340-1]OZD86578.1 LysR family transcriptional regulator [Rhodococcus sp. 05-339-2]